MKGKVRCPKCSFTLIIEGEDGEKREIKCPNCGHEFIAIIGERKDKEIKWIEWGGARKAILPLPENISNKPLIAGILLAIAGVAGVVSAFLSYVYFNTKIFAIFRYLTEDYKLIFLSLVIFSIIALFGSYCSMKRKSFAISLTGCIFGILSLGFLVLSPILSIISLVLILLSKNEFENSLHGKEF